MTTNLAAYGLAAAAGPRAEYRTATVSSATANQVIISAGGTSFAASYVEPYQPVAGDLVAAFRQEGAWIVIGRIAGVGANEVVNPSFEDSPSGSFPVNWILYNISGESSAGVGSSEFAPDGNNIVTISGDGGATTQSYLYSEPIPVIAGDSFEVSAYVGGQYLPDAAQTADTALFALWFAQDTDLYPTTSSADTSLAALNDVPQIPPFSTMSGTATAPVSGFMRVALRSTLGPDQALSYDLVVARRLP